MTTSFATMPVQRHEPAGAAERTDMSADGLENIVDVFTAMVATGDHPGAQLAVCRNGELVLEAAAGADHEGRPVQLDSLLGVLSTTKMIAALVAHTLHDRGLFEYEDPVAKHWPAFGVKGKESITIGQVMSHRAGLTKGQAEGYLEWKKWLKPGGVERLMIDHKVHFPPGSANGYHAFSYGFILDQLTRRWTGRDLGQVLRDEITGPLGIDDVYIGLPEPQYRRFIKFDPSPGQRLVPRFLLPRGGEKSFFNSPLILAQCLPWGGGVARAASLARLNQVYANEGTLDGHTFFSRETFARVVTPTNADGEKDVILGTRVQWGLGVHLALSEGTPATEGWLFGDRAGPRALGHLGGNSSLSWADPDLRLSMTFISTSAKAPARYERLSSAVRDACA